MTKQDLKERYEYWLEVAQNTTNARLKRAAKFMAVRYQRAIGG